MKVQQKFGNTRKYRISMVWGGLGSTWTQEALLLVQQDDPACLDACLPGCLPACLPACLDACLPACLDTG